MGTKQGTGKPCANNSKDDIKFKRKTQYVVVTLVRLITLIYEPIRTEIELAIENNEIEVEMPGNISNNKK